MVSSDEVDTDDGELNGSQEKSPLETAAIQNKLHRLVTPLGPIKEGPDSLTDEGCGRMLKAARVSTRKRLLDSWLVT